MVSYMKWDGVMSVGLLGLGEVEDSYFEFDWVLVLWMIVLLLWKFFLIVLMLFWGFEGIRWGRVRRLWVILGWRFWWRRWGGWMLGVCKRRWRRMSGRRWRVMRLMIRRLLFVLISILLFFWRFVFFFWFYV